MKMKVIRFSNEQVLYHLKDVLNKLILIISEIR